MLKVLKPSVNKSVDICFLSLKMLILKEEQIPIGYFTKKDDLLHIGKS